MTSRNSLRSLFAASTILGLAALAPVQASHAETKNVSHWISKAQKVGAAADSEQVRVVFYLGLRNVDSLRDLIKSLSTRGSPLYGKYLSPDEFRSRFAPAAGDVALVRDTLEEMGFRIESIPKSGFFVETSATVGRIRAALGVSQDLYAYKGMVLRANSETPKLPAKIASLVTYVKGLDDSGALRRPYHVRDNEADSARKPAMARDLNGRPDAPPPPQDLVISPVCSNYFGDHAANLTTGPAPYAANEPWLVCGYTPQQLRQAYGADQVPQTGNAVRVGIVDAYASPTIVADANAYSKNHGLPLLGKFNFRQLIPAGIYNVPASAICGPQGWYEEESLDVQAVHSMAPDAYILFIGSLDCGSSLDVAVYDAIDNRDVDILTNSWGDDGEEDTAADIAMFDQAAMQAAAEGMSILFSSGDDGDNAAFNGIASSSLPASSPYVTAVGGTSLALLNAGSGDLGASKNEWGWGTYRGYLQDAKVWKTGTTIRTTGVDPLLFTYGSGGGPSLVELAPDYQAAVPYSLAGYTTLANGDIVPLEAPHRVTPDIAMDADPDTGFIYGETYATTGDPILDLPCKPLTDTTEYCETRIGGTSLSSPLFAGVLALVDQARLDKGMPVVGFVNPALYALPVSGDSLQYEPILDVFAPTQPTAVLRGYLGASKRAVRLVTMNSVPISATAVLEGADSSYLTTPGFDEVTGLGTPWVPLLIQALGK